MERQAILAKRSASRNMLRLGRRVSLTVTWQGEACRQLAPMGCLFAKTGAAAGLPEKQQPDATLKVRPGVRYVPNRRRKFSVTCRRTLTLRAGGALPGYSQGRRRFLQVVMGRAFTIACRLSPEPKVTGLNPVGELLAATRPPMGRCPLCGAAESPGRSSGWAMGQESVEETVATRRSGNNNREVWSLQNDRE